GKPFSNSMTYSVLKGFHGLWASRGGKNPGRPADPDPRRYGRSRWRENQEDPGSDQPLHAPRPSGARLPILRGRTARNPQRRRKGSGPSGHRALAVADSGPLGGEPF